MAGPRGDSVEGGGARTRPRQGYFRRRSGSRADQGTVSCAASTVVAYLNFVLLGRSSAQGGRAGSGRCDPSQGSSAGRATDPTLEQGVGRAMEGSRAAFLCTLLVRDQSDRGNNGAPELRVALENAPKRMLCAKFGVLGRI